ncbi:YeeE/YedE family protein [Fulvivirga sedimenti]|uniref:YeeE/YedE family protein n=1 Tax=Fulvivirga sedimenti TaxID=2879465 RepID=A0A9X1HKJ5_9BACT|nr:YeeE/YedE thiosulfate transporter family protein [Fulvivirga sedimenti]MCA6073566.1 YeeE/YedE family protein [Fulvivirga sedimenti]
MNDIISFISQPWPWYVAGPLIAVIMFLLIYFGNNFGVSNNFRTICAMTGAGKNCDFFQFDWKSQIWNLVFVFGTVIGGFIAHEFLMPDTAVHISEATKMDLAEYGMMNAGEDFIPTEIFNWESLLTLKGFIMIVVGGFLVGFGTRYAGGCTSGHAISGLSDLQLPSLIAVIGFFIGGLFMTYVLLPYILTL